MNYFYYKVEHDFGLAPNPFHGYCTIAVCKSQIRNNKKLNKEDWIIGTGSKALNSLNKIIFVMKVQEILSFDEYWNDERFQEKKPIINGSLVQMYGDNIYHFDKQKKEWIQENSAHSKIEGIVNKDHLKRDVGGENVLISQIFYYFGDNCLEIPSEFLKELDATKLRNYKYLSSDLGKEFVEWIEDNHKIGIHGDPISWNKHLG